MADVTGDILATRNIQRKHPLAKCEECPLAEIGTFVPSKAPQGGSAKIAVVGEAPGFQEATHGEPFIGPSGKLLDKVLEHHGIERNRILLTNTCLCRPPDNSTPPTAAVRACQPRLKAEIEAVGATQILALGKTAAHALLPTTRGILELRTGPAQVSNLVPSAVVVPTVHPAFCHALGTKLLKTDLTWSNVEDIQVGDELIGFDEFAPGMHKMREFKASVVESVLRLKQPCYKITTSEGTTISTGDHLWLAKYRSDRPKKWVPTSKLNSKFDLHFFLAPWDVATDYAAGYLSGFFDGEAYLHKQDGLGWGQNNGPHSERVVRLCEEYGFEVRTSLQEGAKCRHFNLGGRWQGLRAMGMFRPIRLMPKAEFLWAGARSAKNVPILSVAYVGELDVVAVNTATKTYIADGYMSHNCLRSGDNFPHLVRDVGKLVNPCQVWVPPKYVIAEAEPIGDRANEIEAAMKVNLEKVEPGHALATLEPQWDITFPVAVLRELIALQQSRSTITTKPPLVIDIECGIEKDTDFDHPNKYQMLCVGLGYDKGRVVVVGEQALKAPLIRQLLKELFALCSLGAHNGKFDLSGLYPLLGKLQLGFDTMLKHYVTDERPGNHGLKALAVDLLGAPQYDRELDKYLSASKNYANIPRPILYKYNAYDIGVTWDLNEYLDVEIEKVTTPTCPWGYVPWSLQQLHDHLIAASNQLMFLELNGITIDRAYSRQLESDYLQVLANLEDQLDALVNPPDQPQLGEDGEPGKSLATQRAELTPRQRKATMFNPRSPLQVKRYLHSQGIRVASTNKDTLEELQNKVKPDSEAGKFVALLLLHRRKAKLHGTYIKGIRARMYRGRVYTTYMLHGTTSGRLASRNPNLQNIVRDELIRRQFVAKPGNILMQADYSQVEGRIIAWLAKDEYLRSIFMDPNRKLFRELSDRLYGEGKWGKEQYIRTKAYFYGLSYGRDAFSIAMEYGWSVSEAERDLRRFKNLIPAVEQWQEDVRSLVLNGQDLVTPFGRRRRFWLITKENRKDVLNEALSFLPQSTASDVCLSALIRLRPMLSGKAFIRLTIHDALVVECKESDREEVASMMQQVMLEEGAKLTDYVPFTTEVSWGNSWGDFE